MYNAQRYELLRLGGRRLDASAVEALEKYVAGGGGVAFFLGERTDGRYFNEVLYRDGKGLFPMPLARPAELVVDRLEPAPDIHVDEHFIFRVFAAKRNTFLQTVSVQQYFAAPEGWRPLPGNGTLPIQWLSWTPACGATRAKGIPV